MIRLLRAPAQWLAVALEGIAAVMLFVMMWLTCVDVFSRYLLNNPVTGATELTEIMLAVVVLTAMPMITLRGDHIVVDLTDPLFSPTVHKIRQSVIGLVCAVALFFLGGRIFVLAERALRNREVTEHLEIPTGYVIHFIGVSCWLTATLGVAFALVVPFTETPAQARSESGDSPG